MRILSVGTFDGALFRVDRHDDGWRGLGWIFTNILYILFLSRFRIHQCIPRAPRPTCSTDRHSARVAHFFWHDRDRLAIAVIPVMVFFKSVHRVAQKILQPHILMKVFGTLGGQEISIPTKKIQVELWNISTHRELECRDF